MAATPMAVTDPQMMSSIVEELVAYNPTAGAVFGVELMRMGHMMIAADDGSAPYLAMPQQNLDWSGGIPRVRPVPPPMPAQNGNHRAHRKTDVPPMPPGAKPRQADDVPLLETVRGRPPNDAPLIPPKRPPTAPPEGPQPRASEPNIVAGEIGARPASQPSSRASSQPSPEALAASSGEIPLPQPRPKNPSDPAPRQAGTVEVPRSPDEITQPNLRTPVPGSVRVIPVMPNPAATPIPPPPSPDEPRGAIMGIGVGAIGTPSPASTVSGEIQKKVAPGARVLVPGPNGLMQSATVRQLLSGYYELEVGSSGETIWVPVSGVVPE
jgi:hypothetical protein